MEHIFIADVPFGCAEQSIFGAAGPETQFVRSARAIDKHFIPRHTDTLERYTGFTVDDRAKEILDITRNQRHDMRKPNPRSSIAGHASKHIEKFLYRHDAAPKNVSL